MIALPCALWKYCVRAEKSPIELVPSRTPTGSSSTRICGRGSRAMVW